MHRQPHIAYVRSPQPGVSDVSIALAQRRAIAEYRPDTVELEDRIDEITSEVEGALRRRLNHSTLSALDSFATTPSRNAVLVLRGAACGVSDTVAAAYDGVSHETEVTRATAILLGFIAMAGQRPMSFEDENDGRVGRLVVATHMGADSVGSQGARIQFGPHVDNNNRPHWFEWADGLPEPIPAMLGFVCINPDPDVPTWVSPLSEIVRTLSPPELAVLQANEFNVHPPSSNDSGDVLIGVPVLTTDEQGEWVCRADVTHTKGLTPRASEALLALGRAARAVATPLRLGRSDVCLFWNEYSMHFRGAYTPRGDATDRMLVRVYGRRDLPIGNPAAQSAPWRRR